MATLLGSVNTGAGHTISAYYTLSNTTSTAYTVQIDIYYTVPSGGGSISAGGWDSSELTNSNCPYCKVSYNGTVVAGGAYTRGSNNTTAGNSVKIKTCTYNIARSSTSYAAHTITVSVRERGVIAKPNPSGLTNYSLSGTISVPAAGAVRIYVESANDWKYAIPYIYSESAADWKQAIPYVYSESASDWKICGG